MKVLRGAEIGSDLHLVLMKLNKKSKGEGRDRVSSGARIRIERLKDRLEQLRHQWKIRQSMNSGRCLDDQMEGKSIEKVWVEFKEGVLSKVVEVCG